MTAIGHPAADPADWASRIAERLPAADIRDLARATAEGVPAIRALRAATAASVVRNACDQLLASLDRLAPAYLAGLLDGAACAIERMRRHQSVDVVWTGPASGITTSRLTAATVIELIAEASREILLVSFATQTEPAIGAALKVASVRGVSITMLTERNADNPGYAPAGTPFPGLNVMRLHWSAAQSPPEQRCTQRSSW